MRTRKQDPSVRFVNAVVGFVAGTHMWGKSRPSTYSLLLESRRLDRLTKEMNKKYGLTGKGR